eukprot:scaffold102295_cov15-Tisochrysis_lutea.AAC.1
MTFMICGGVAVFLAIILYQSDACPCPGRDGYDDHDGLGRKMAGRMGRNLLFIAEGCHRKGREGKGCSCTC